MKTLRYAVLLLLSPTACETDVLVPDYAHEPQPGDTSFVSAIPGGADRLADNADPTASEDTGRETGENREIEEADIVRLDGNTLYVLNAYRGLEIIDVTNADAPSILGSARVFGYPVEMYIDGTRAYIVVSNYFTYWGFALDSAAHEWRGSQIVIVDIANKAAPEVLARLNVEGYITNTRRLGDVLYVVSNRYAWYSCSSSTDSVDLTFVASIDIYDPNDIHEVERLSFPGSSNFIHVTQNALFVAQYRWDWTGANSTYGSDVTYVDISDPAGAIVERGSFGVPGYLFDRYAMDWYNNSFRIVTYFWEGQGHSELFTFDTSDPGNIVPQGSLSIADAGSLMATRFAGERAYTIHLPRTNIDPLDVIDLSDPANPQLKAILEIPGWVSHLEVRGFRLIALGVDDTAWPRRASVKLFDTTVAEAPVLLSEASVGEGQSWSQADWDPKALTILDDQGLIFVPFSSWTTDSYMSGVQIISYVGDSLSARGVMTSDGYITRTRSKDDRVLALSSEFLEVYDATDLDDPVRTAALELAWNVGDFVTLGDYGVQLVGNWWSYYGNAPAGELRVVALANPDSGPMVARIPVDATYGRLYQNGALVYLTSFHYDYATYTSSTRISVFDFSEPTAPVARGELELPIYAWDYYGGIYWWWGWYGGEVVHLGDRLVFHPQGYWYVYDQVGAAKDAAPNAEPTAAADSLWVVDLRNPDELGVVEVELDNYALRVSGRGDTVFYTYAVPVAVSSSSYTWAQYFLGRLDVSDPAAPRTRNGINIPGQFLDADTSGHYIYTLDWRWDASGNLDETFNSLRLFASHAVLLDRLDLSDRQSSFAGLTVKDNVGYMLRQSWSWACDVPPNMALQLIDARAPASVRFAGAFTLSGYGMLMDVQHERAFLTTGWGESLALLDVSDPEAPSLAGAYRTLGYPVAVRVAGDTAYLPSGYYGVQTVPLSAGNP